VSPAIEVEAATRSPFVRTLTPEVEALDGAWFQAGEAQEAAVASPIPAPLSLEDLSDSGSAPAPEPSEPAAYEAVARPAWNLGSRWLRVGAFAGGALSVIVAVLVVTRGRSPAQQQPVVPAAALVQVDPPAAKPSPDNGGLVPAAAAAPAEPLPAEPAPVAAAPAPPPSVPVAPAPAEAPPPPREPPAPTPVAEAVPTPAPPAPPSQEAPPVTEAPARPAGAPREALAAAPREAQVAPAPRAPRPRKPVVDKPKPAAAPTGVRMHNGVPLLD
jgi:hypothetical protein